MCRLRNIALKSVTEKCDRRTDRQTDRQTDGQTTDKVIPMCRYASQATQKLTLVTFLEEFMVGHSFSSEMFLVERPFKVTLL